MARKRTVGKHPVADIDAYGLLPQKPQMRAANRLEFALLASVLAIGCSAGEASSSDTPKVYATSTLGVSLTGYVTDAADVLNAKQEARISANLAELGRTTHHQMVVITVPTLGGQDIAKFTKTLGNDWGIGRKGYDDGVVLLIAPKERRARIAVGYGLEKRLPDALCERIMRDQIIPNFKKGDLAGGIERGVDALISRMK